MLRLMSHWIPYSYFALACYSWVTMLRLMLHWIRCFYLVFVYYFCNYIEIDVTLNSLFWFNVCLLLLQLRWDQCHIEFITLILCLHVILVTMLKSMSHWICCFYLVFTCYSCNCIEINVILNSLFFLFSVKHWIGAMNLMWDQSNWSWRNYKTMCQIQWLNSTFIILLLLICEFFDNYLVNYVKVIKSKVFRNLFLNFASHWWYMTTYIAFLGTCWSCFFRDGAEHNVFYCRCCCRPKDDGKANFGWV